ncbi:MAG: hypothetical protein U0936_17530 [Planctomycetaceae bacterium]
MGISLTVVNVTHDQFSVALIPHTLQVTTLGNVAVGDVVNIENDVLGSHVDQLLERRFGSIQSPAVIQYCPGISMGPLTDVRPEIDRIRKVHRRNESSPPPDAIFFDVAVPAARHQPARRSGTELSIDVNLIEFAVRAAELGPRDVALEVGSGTGGMTAFLAQDAGRGDLPISTRTCRSWQPKLFRTATTSLPINSDILKNKNTLDPFICDVIRHHVASIPDGRLKLPGLAFPTALPRPSYQTSLHLICRTHGLHDPVGTC